MRVNKLGLFIVGAILTFGLWVACSGEAKAQDGGSKIKAYVGFINGSYDFPVLNNRGINISAEYAAYKYEGVKIEAVGDFSGYLTSEDKVYTYLFGPQVSVDLFEGRLTPFARILFGATRYEGQASYAHSIGGGLDVNVGKHLFARPFAYDKQSSQGNGQPVHRIGVGVGYRF